MAKANLSSFRHSNSSSSSSNSSWLPSSSSSSSSSCKCSSSSSSNTCSICSGRACYRCPGPPPARPPCPDRHCPRQVRPRPRFPPQIPCQIPPPTPHPHPTPPQPPPIMSGFVSLIGMRPPPSRVISPSVCVFALPSLVCSSASRLVANLLADRA